MEEGELKLVAAKCLMIQGTASSVGKSLLVAALCRILRQDGYRVAPFKAQNMALNSAVTADGAEIGRAQAMQAEAAGIAATREMNPILLKPEADSRSQLVVLGKPLMTLEARDYYRQKSVLWGAVVESLESLRAEHDVIVIEGAGSPAEVNLKDDDIVNMRVAKLADAPVLLVGDIDRGGVFASLVGTLALLDRDERALVRGLVINKFRGDLGLLLPGLRFIEERTGKTVLGVVPYLPEVGLADEDSVAFEGRLKGTAQRGKTARDGRDDWVVGQIDVAVVALPHISNFDDFDPLEHEPEVNLRYVREEGDLGCPDLVILPGTKTTVHDLQWLKARGLAARIEGLARQGVAVIGICGGFQMLGREVRDPLGVEGQPCASEGGLGLLPVITTFERSKTIAQVRATVKGNKGLIAGMRSSEITGYEIHMGASQCLAGKGDAPFRITQRSESRCEVDDGMIDERGLILGTYLHGLFANTDLERAMLRNLADGKGVSLRTGPRPSLQSRYDRLAEHVRANLDVERIYQLAGF